MVSHLRARWLLSLQQWHSSQVTSSTKRTTFQLQEDPAKGVSLRLATLRLIYVEAQLLIVLSAVARNMQSPAYNLKYAQSISSLASPLAAIKGTPGSPDYDNDVLGLLISNDVLDFGSGAWYLASQCSDAIRSGLQSRNQAGFEAYVSECINTTDQNGGRLEYWKRANAAL